MTENARIEDLRRRLQRDPASIAFAQLAEEYRRAGDFEEAVRVCQVGLAQHPAFLSARVTLGRALFQLGRMEEARTEFLRVLEAAPDNLIAVGKLAEIHQRTQQSDQTRADRSRDERSTDERIIAELEAWLDVISERRLSRR